MVQIGPEKYRAGEVLFNPSLLGVEYLGVHHTLVNSINKCDLDLRRTLFSEIVLAGGSTLFTGSDEKKKKKTPFVAIQGFACWIVCHNSHMIVVIEGRRWVCVWMRV